jgi:aminomethyltransferase
MVPYAGWEMALQFAGLLKEHKAVRERCGVFDISHMGVLRLSGPGAKDALQALVPTDLFRIGPGEASYTVLLNERGGIVDDLIMYDKGWDEANQANELILVVNASRTEHDEKWLREKLKASNIAVDDIKGSGVLLALQGPDSAEVLSGISGEPMRDLPAFGHRMMEIPGLGEAFVARTGYTGEDGFELLMSAEMGQEFWKICLLRGVEPCGLGARDMLRLEAGMLLYGNDMDETTTPLESGLGWLVHLEMQKGFMGREALEEQTINGAETCLISLTIEGRAIPREGCVVVTTGGASSEIVGYVTSGGWSPELNRGIALARIKRAYKEKALDIKVKGKRYQARKSKRSFLKREA